VTDAGPPRPLRFGLLTPVVTLLPGTPAWEERAGPAELVDVARAADRLGYHHLTCSEHVAIPAAVAEKRGARYYDPVATFGFLGGLTRSIRLLTHVVVVPYHHPLALAKRYGTVDALSGGRLILGCGVGSLAEEFALLGAPFADRGDRVEDALAALRAALGQRAPVYAGTHYQFSDMIVDPCAAQGHVPIWLGGRSPRSLRRALTLGDGWDPFGLPLAELGEIVRRARDGAAWRDRHAPFDVALGACHPFLVGEPLLDIGPAAGATALADRIARMREAGATVVHLTFAADSLAHYVDQLERFAQEIAPRFQ
jgi:probable F420-dependent oxidoreductase